MNIELEKILNAYNYIYNPSKIMVNTYTLSNFHHMLKTFKIDNINDFMDVCKFYEQVLEEEVASKKYRCSTKTIREQMVMGYGRLKYYLVSIIFRYLLHYRETLLDNESLQALIAKGLVESDYGLYMSSLHRYANYIYDTGKCRLSSLRTFIMLLQRPETIANYRFILDLYIKCGKTPNSVVTCFTALLDNLESSYEDMINEYLTKQTNEKIKGDTKE